MKRTISWLLVLSLTGMMAAQDDATGDVEIMYTNEPVKSATVEQADDYSSDVTVKEKDGATQEAVAQESEEEPEIIVEQDSDLQPEKSDEVTYEEYD